MQPAQPLNTSMKLCHDEEAAVNWRVGTWEQHQLRDRVWPEVEALERPTDLGRWAHPATISAWIASEVERLKWKPSESATHWSGAGTDWNKVLATVLGYAYARQMYDSQEIVRDCGSDAALVRLCGGSVPFAAELESFRRRNRTALEKALAGVFTRAMRHRFDLGREPLPAELEEDMRALAAERLNIARHMGRAGC